jgi:YVTN family beta-propeller protein
MVFAVVGLIGLSVTTLANATPVVTGTVGVGSAPIGVAVNPITNKIYVANMASDSVSVIDGATGLVSGSPIAVGNYPYGVAADSTTNRIYVANRSGNSVSVIDGATGLVVGSPITVGSSPQAIAVNPITNKVYVANTSSNNVSVIDGATGLVVGSPIAVGFGPTAVAVNPTTNKVYVTNGSGNSVSIIDGATGLVVGSPVTVGGFPFGVAVDPTTNKVYVANEDSSTVSVIDGATGLVVGTPIAVTSGASGVAVNPATGRVYVANWHSQSVSIIDGGTGLVVGSPITVGSEPWGVAVNPTTKRVYVGNYDSNTVSIIQDDPPVPPVPAISGIGVTNPLAWDLTSLKTTRVYATCNLPGRWMTIDVWDAHGVVQTLYSGPAQQGVRVVTPPWDGRDSSGRRLPTGNYRYRVRVNRSSDVTSVTGPIVVSRVWFSVSTSTTSGQLTRYLPSGPVRVYATSPHTGNVDLHAAEGDERHPEFEINPQLTDADPNPWSAEYRYTASIKGRGSFGPLTDVIVIAGGTGPFTVTWVQ